MKKNIASLPNFLQSDPVQLSPLAEVAAQIAVLGHELPMSGRLLYAALENALLKLRPGRAPQSLGLADSIAESEAFHQVLVEIVSEAQSASLALAEHASSMHDAGLAEQQQLFERECIFWKTFSDRVHHFLKRLTLFAAQEKSTALGLDSLGEAWKELKRFAQTEAP